MTTTTVTKRALTPDPADIEEFRQHLGTRDSYGYAYATGYLGSIIDALASEHRCRKPDCLTCDRLRRGLALIAAITAVETDKPAGDAS